MHTQEQREGTRCELEVTPKRRTETETEACQREGGGGGGGVVVVGGGACIHTHDEGASLVYVAGAGGDDDEAGNGAADSAEQRWLALECPLHGLHRVQDA